LHKLPPLFFPVKTKYKKTIIIIIIIIIIITIKFTLVQATKFLRGSSVIYILFFKLGARWGGGQHHASAALSPEKTPGTHSTRGWEDPRAGHDGCGKTRFH
jgi:hypothetical protein